jgi:hypothetical protein
MSWQPISAPLIARRTRISTADWLRRLAEGIVRHPWIVVTPALIAASVAFVVVSGIRPEFDTYGWLVWGREAAHLALDTNSAPSWKPLTFLFTFPYALAGSGAVWLWMMTAVAAAFAAILLAARIAYRLAGRSTERPYARIAAAAFAGFGVLALGDYWHYILISASDPLVVALCLAAIDCHLSRRSKLAWLALVLASLGRPEVWPAAAVYGLWKWRSAPSMRLPIVAGVLLIPALWFAVAALTSPSWSIAADIATESTVGVPRHGPAGVLQGFWHLYDLPMKVVVVLGLGLAVVRRDRTSLMLIWAALSWVLVEVVFALHGWTGAARYTFEPAAVLVVLGGAAIGQVVGAGPRRMWPLRWAALAAILAALAATLISPTETRIRLAGNEISFLAHGWSRQIDRLHTAIANEGGAKRIMACGQPVTEVAFQTILAWQLGQNVADVGWDPRTWIAAGEPIVLFEPQGAGWKVQPIHTPADSIGRCAALTRDTASN